jgi:hypothetical protein
METPVIRYNLKDRGRQYTGQRRDFNIRAVCDAINGPACQETVASRGMLGFYGHLPRVRYGMRPVDGGIEAGKYAPVEPAIVTTYLKADYNGNVEHRAEFLDTAAGRLAEKLWGEKVGGFSSAIDDRKPEFYGFDYVGQPNFLNNSFRGVVLDDVTGGGLGNLTYDDIYAAEQEEQAQTLIVLLDSVHVERERTSEVIERLSAENEHLLSLLAAAKGPGETVSLDAAGIAPLALGTETLERMRRDAAAFRSCALPGFIEPGREDNSPANASPVYARLLGKMTRR